MTPPLVYTLVINWNGMAHVHACFQSLLQSAYPNAVHVLLDNASTDGSADYVEQTFGDNPHVQVWRLLENLGWSGGNNAGIQRALDAGAEYIFLLNNDTWTAPDAIGALVDAANAQRQTAALAPLMVLYDTPGVINSLGLNVSRIGACWDAHMGRAATAERLLARPTLGVCGGAMFLRADALRQCGLLDETFGIYYDDADLCLRFWQQGWRCETCPGALVRHKFSASFASEESQRRKVLLSERNRLRFMALNFPLGHLLNTLPWLALAELRIFGSALRDGAYWRLRVQAVAWWTLFAQLAEICRRRRGRFSPEYARHLSAMLHAGSMFCPVVVLPQHGFYATEQFEDCFRYPCAAEVCVGVSDPAARLTLWDAADNLIYDGPLRDASQVQAERFTFEADSLRSAEDSGRPFDVGGFVWVGSPDGSPLDLWQVFFPLKELDT